MKRFVIGMLWVFAVSLLAQPTGVSADVQSWQRGMSVVPRFAEDYGSETFRQSIRDLASTNVNYVTLVVPLAQSNIYATDVGPTWNTPTDETLRGAVQFIHSLGLHVNLKPHVDSHDGQWRAQIRPYDREEWFRRYGDILERYARLAAEEGVAQVTVGSELIHLSADDAHEANTRNWRALIGRVRSVYNGKVTYSANWGSPGWTDEKNRITFWGDLDSIGISAYYPLPTGNPSVEAFKAEWDRINRDDITPLQQRYRKPILFTEVGYRSTDWAHWEPFTFQGGGAYDPENQSELYEALYSYWNGQDFFQGVHLWDWSTDPNAGGEGNIDYTPQNKPAEQTLTRLNQGGISSPEPTPSTSFEASASAPAPLTTGQDIPVSVQVRSTDSSASNVIVDVEIYSGGTRVHQQVYEGQYFAAGETKSFTVNWTPSSAGKFTVKVGVFPANWSRVLTWNDSALVMQVDDAQTGGNSGSQTGERLVDVWWPSDSISITGMQPFKAMLTNESVENYRMFWQVDGGNWVEMPTNMTDYPHKEIPVDVSGWNWQGEGPYTVTFIAQDLSGNTIAQKSIHIFVR